MKKLIGFFLAGAVLITQAVALHAATSTSTFTLTATIPTATGTTIGANKVTGPVGAEVWTPVAGTAMSFGTLTLTPVDGGLKVFFPSCYFAIDISGTGGLGTPSTTVTWSEGNHPGATILGHRGNVSFMAMKYDPKKPTKPTETSMSSHPKHEFYSLNKTISSSDVKNANNGEWLRIYVGLNDGKDADPFFVPFTLADAPGEYTGTLTITATI
jgi:hypothetical protein